MVVGQLQGLALGWGINVTSNDAGYPGVAAALALLALMASVAWLRGRQDAPLTQWAFRGLLAAALGAVLLGAVAPLLLPTDVNPNRWAGVAALAGAALTVGAVLLSALDRALNVGGAAAGIGFAAALGSLAVPALAEGQFLQALGLITIAGGSLFFAWGSLAEDNLPVAILGVAGCLLLVAVALGVAGIRLPAVAFLGAALCFSLFWFALRRDDGRWVLTGASGIGLSLLLLFGAMIAGSGWSTTALLLISTSLSLPLVTVGWYMKRRPLAVLGMSLMLASATWFGIDMARAGELLFGIAVWALFIVSVSWLGSALFDRRDLERLRSTWKTITSASTGTPGRSADFPSVRVTESRQPKDRSEDVDQNEDSYREQAPDRNQDGHLQQRADDN